MRNSLPEVSGVMSQMIRFCLLEEVYPRQFIDGLAFILLLEIFSIHQMSKEGRKDKTSIKGDMMILVRKETLAGRDTRMDMTGTGETPVITKMLLIIDHPGPLMTEEILRGNGKKSLLKINNLLIVVLGAAQAQWSFQSTRRPRQG